MKYTKLFEKKLQLIFPGPREYREVDVIQNFVFAGVSSLHWNQGLNRSDAKEYCRMCNEYEIEIVGIEIHPDSPYPIHVFTQEDYVLDEYTWKWIEAPLIELEALGIDSFIIPIVHVPDEILDKYLSG